MAYAKILSDISQGKLKPVYYLHGAESFFIDKIVQKLDEDGVVLTEGEKAFNRTVLYGADASIASLMNACRSFPVMANRKLVILKEAHRFPKTDWPKFVSYLEQPVPSTILVLVFRDPKVGLPKAAATAAKKHGEDFFAKKMYDRDVQQWISGHIQDAGFQAAPEVSGILTSNLGTNIGLISNELEKMFIALKASQQTKLSKDLVYDMINVDKQFNSFELVGALAEKNRVKAHMIVDKLTQNVKINPPILTLSSLYNFFHHISLVHRFKLRDPNSIKHQFGVNYFQAKDYAAGSARYSVQQTHRNLSYLREADLMLKGVKPTLMDESHILKTLVWKLLS
ncbi:MAG: DNA polymerase III subunit delta [Bacteroidota bacterium]